MRLIRCFCFFSALGHDKAQSIIDQITSAYESGGGPPPGGFGFGPQHLTPNGPGFVPPGYGGPPGPAGFRRSAFSARERYSNVNFHKLVHLFLQDLVASRKCRQGRWVPRVALPSHLRLEWGPLHLDSVRHTCYF